MPNMNYSLAPPSMDAIVSAFGSARDALEKTGGDVPTLCYLLNNPGVLAGLKSISEVRGELYAALQDRADCDDVAKAWDEQTGKRKTIAEVMRQTGMGFVKAKRLLVASGRVK